MYAKDRASLCTFTFVDGRRCRTPRQSGHPQFCCFHARKQAQVEAAEQLGRDFAYFFSGDYFSACDLAAALGRLFAAVARGEVKPRTAATLAYLAQTLLQTIHLAEHEYSNAFGSDDWRKIIYSHVKENANYLARGPAQNTPQPAPQPAPKLTDQASKPAADSASQPTTASAAEPATPEAS
ncbi:MAG: hypothetical protein DMG35_17365 [Acidobacteria bacterium]|nr:MAG: hypothetical protein AUH86_00305 [Acidobacteria bacterium 13_1_40CM_4_58_4]PYT58533.1 MAG: hypothetical protein DMG35_17365 [Acidobacteriota bacterium]